MERTLVPAVRQEKTAEVGCQVIEGREAGQEYAPAPTPPGTQKSFEKSVNVGALAQGASLSQFHQDGRVPCTAAGRITSEERLRAQRGHT